jgi:hypothetical protein
LRVCLFLPTIFAAAIACSGHVLAQSPFPAPLPGQAQAGDSVSASENIVPGVPAGPPSPFTGAGTSPVLGGSGWASKDAAELCKEEFIPLREEAERRGRLIKAASDRHAPPDEACRLISDFEQAEVQMIKYVEAHTQSCGIPAPVADQLKGGHTSTEALMKKVCMVADQRRQGVNGNFDRVWPPKGPTGDFNTVK